MRTFNSLLLSCLILLCSPPSLATTTTPPLSIKLNSGTYQGVSTGNGIERWLGIRYAQPPVGSLRFKAPVAVNSSNATYNASTFGNACPQPLQNPLGINIAAPNDEDCLFLNIYRPANTTAKSALPVLVWIHGGAWTLGAASDPSTDPTRIMQRSISTNKPIIFVSLNYRLNTFGFIASSSMDPQDLNAGLLDQRQAFTFVQQNIAAFGGDPKKVTIWGQSVGGGSVEAHFLYPASTPLFRAGIANSPTGPFKTSPPAGFYDKPGQSFANLLAATNCSAGPDAIACLQAVPLPVLNLTSSLLINSSLNGQLWQPVIGPSGSFAPELASTRIQAGNFLHLPFLGGVNANDGTSFSSAMLGLNLTGASQDIAFTTFIKDVFTDNSTITSDVIQNMLQMYPSNETALAPTYNTSGDVLFDRAAAWYTEEMFLAPYRMFLQQAASHQPVWAYHYKELIPGNRPILGVFHGSELPLLFGPVPSVETDFANQYLDFYINFVNYLNPGSAWPRSNSKQVLQLQRNNITVIPDTFDLNKTNYLNTPEILAAFQK